MSNITSPDKTTGQDHFAVEYQEFKDWMNGPSKSLATFNPSAITLDGSGTYTDYTVTGNIILAFTGTPKKGNWQKVRTTGWNGTYTLSVGNGVVIVNNSFTQGGAVASGTYDLWLAYVGGEYQVNLVEVTITTVAAPTISNFAIASANPDRITFDSSEVVTATTFGGFTLGGGKTITGITINAGQTTGHYFTVNIAYVEADGNDTIAYSGTGCDMQNLLGVALESFTATTVTNNIDSSAPTFTAGPSSANISSTSFDITATLSENGTVYAVVVADGAAAPTSSEVKAGTGSGGTGQLATDNAVDSGSGVTLTLSGLSVSTAYDCYVVAEDTLSNLQATPTLVNVTTGTGVVASDDFNDGTIDTSIWTLTDVADGTSVNETGGDLVIEGNGLSSDPATDNMVSSESKAEIASGTIQCSISMSATTYDYSAAFFEAKFDDTDGNVNRVAILRGSGVGTLTDRILVTVNGTSIVDTTAGLDLTTERIFRISYDGVTVKVDYYGGAIWNNVVSQAATIAGNFWCRLLGGNANTGADNKQSIFDNFYMTTEIGYTAITPA